ncbi:hypothetical protein [Thalassobaculum litoreum]|uniref:hypothetical protein n=1 Tax=Thalassobaculum litoreum TaxID=420996 RepID=UPI000B83E283|nr:hypothetical protein [Thalassobaculum litoreum]
MIHVMLVEFVPTDPEAFAHWRPFTLPVEAGTPEEALRKAEAAVATLLPHLGWQLSGRVPMISAGNACYLTIVDGAVVEVPCDHQKPGGPHA